MRKLKPGDVVSIWADDEVPALGSGRRYVAVESLGPKWARLTVPNRSTAVKVRRPLFNRLVVEEEDAA